MDEELCELCKQVYEKTQWDEGELYCEQNDDIPLYTSDYLLEKLPDTIGLYRDELSPSKWTAACEDGISYGGKHVDCGDEECGCESYYGEANTPLKALLKLTVALKEVGEI